MNLSLVPNVRCMSEAEYRRIKLVASSKSRKPYNRNVVNEGKLGQREI
jgi:hypothetical protein